MKTFSDLEFKEHRTATEARELKENNPEVWVQVKDTMEKYLNHKQALIEFDNGKRLSVIFGKMFYSNGLDTYEIMENKDYAFPIGYLSEEEVTEYMKKMQNEN